MCMSRLHQVVRSFDGSRLPVRDLDGGEHHVSLLAFEGEEPKVGDWLVVHSGFALSPADPDEVAATLAEWESLEKRPIKEPES
jgi:hydrogenase maturation factor